jgi:hypothetical protein
VRGKRGGWTAASRVSFLSFCRRSERKNGCSQRASSRCRPSLILISSLVPPTMLLPFTTTLLLFCSTIPTLATALNPLQSLPEAYDESLTLTPFPSAKVLSAFNFSLSGSWDPEGVTVGSNAIGASSPLSPTATKLIRPPPGRPENSAPSLAPPPTLNLPHTPVPHPVLPPHPLLRTVGLVLASLLTSRRNPSERDRIDGVVGAS